MWRLDVEQGQALYGKDVKLLGSFMPAMLLGPF